MGKAKSLIFLYMSGGMSHFETFDPKTTPTVIPKDAEDDLVIKWITDPLEMDLIIIPQTQIDRTDKCTLVRCEGDEAGEDSHDVLNR